MTGREAPPRLRPTHLFFAFFRAGITGFGGVLPMIRRLMVDERHWQTATEFNELFALCQFLPGANVVNLAVIFGSRQSGLAGCAAALAGLLAAPIVLVLVLAGLYDRYGALPAVRHLITGLSAGAAGLVLSTAAKIAWPLRGSLSAMAIALLGLFAVGVLRLPFLATIGVLVPVSVGLEAWQKRV